MANLYLGLVHYPIYNKNMQVIATAVTNFDIHDISRTARTYDVKKYFLIHPLEVLERPHHQAVFRALQQLRLQTLCGCDQERLPRCGQRREKQESPVIGFSVCFTC